MQCQECEAGLERMYERYDYSISGVECAVLENCQLLRCPAGHDGGVILPDAEVLVERLALHLVRQMTRLTSDQILFLRKTLGMRAADLAALLGKQQREVIEWELGTAEIDVLSEFRLRFEVADQVIRPEMRRAVREEISRVLQRGYIGGISNEQIVIDVAMLYGTSGDPMRLRAV